MKHRPPQSRPTPQPRLRQVIGLHAAREVLKVRPNKVVEIWIKEGGEKSHDLAPFVEFAKAKRLRLLQKPEAFLTKIAPSHQGICVSVSETPDFDFSVLSAESDEKAIFLALDEVSDPHNVGAVLRTAWLLGVKAVMVPENRSAHLTPAVMKVACGAAEHVPLVNVGPLAPALKDLKDKGFWVYGLAGGAKNALPRMRFNEKVVLVVGAEDKGLRSTTSQVCDELISIPQTVADASFNASVAAGLAMYEVARQHNNP
jgi:23S rRNA (guanosine2251-2'-O)-methyltransferase